MKLTIQQALDRAKEIRTEAEARHRAFLIVEAGRDEREVLALEIVHMPDGCSELIDEHFWDLT